MGRSKFPGKPSKSINRKRVSVLQIEQHEETAAATTKPQVTVEEEDNFTAPATASSATAAKNNNKHGRNNDDDDEDDDGGKNGCSGGQTKSGGNNTTNGSSSGSNSNTNNSNNKKENGNSDGSSNGQKNGNSGNTDSIAISDQMTKDQIHSNCNVDTEKTANNNNVEAHDDVDVEDDDDDDKSDEDDSENVEKNNDNMDKKSSITLVGLNCNKLKKPNKKFKNLNILKPEVMLPSSSRQKANGDFNCLSPTIAMNNPFAIDENISKSKSCSEELLKKSDNQSSSESKSDETIMNADTTITPTNADAITVSSNNSDVPTNTMTTESSIATKPKKSVTFKNILETSDDKSAIKKFYNPNYRIPLVSIIKKECMNRPQTSLRSGECIVRPSRLDEIVKNKNNIDKLDSLKFRPSLLSSSALSSASKTFSISLISHAFASKEVSGVRFRETNEEESDTEEPDVEAEAGFKAANKDRSEHENSTADYDEDAECDDEQQMIVDRHFILPKRSTRSSRLIKPNKRLVEDGIICKKSANLTKTKSNANTSTTAATTTTYMLLAPKKETQRNYFGLGNYYETNNVVEGLKLLNSPKGPNNFTEIKPNLSVLTTALNKTAATINTTTTSTASGNNTFGTFGSLKSNSNFVLRQPRLQFESLNEHSTCTSTTALTSQKPIFAVSTLASTTTCSNSSMMGNLNCIVCDSNIHSKNMQQARKYGGLSCAICRKFISKITKKSIAASAGPTVKALQLHCKNDGICCIQPSVKSHSKNFKKTYKERCAACWLNKCLQNLQFSTGHKQRLNDVLTTIKSSNTTDSKCLVHLNTTTDLKLTPMVENESVSMACLKKDPGLLSPTAALTTSANKFSANSNNTIQKWKTAEGLKLNLKSNPLADNVTFGSTPLLRPGVLEKPLFLTSSNNNAIFTVPSDKTTSKEKLNTISAEPQFIQSDMNTESKHTSKNKRKHKEKEKSKDKEKDKDKNKDKDNEQKLPMSSTAETMVTNNATEAKEVEKVYTLTSKENDISDKNIAACSQEVTTATAVEVTNTGETSNTTSEAATINNVVTVADMNKRQRIDLKGPRVKHVCRSASIVLGQPLALFGEDGEIEESSAFEAVQLDDDITTLTQQIAEASSAIKSPTTDKNDNCSTYKEPEIPEKENKIIEVIKNTSDIVGSGTNVPTITTVTTQTATPETITVSNKQQKNSTSNLKPTNLKSTLPLVLMKNPKGYNINTNTSTTTTTHISKKYMRHLSYNNNIETVQQQLRRKDVASAENVVSLNNYKTKTLISIDFWENYDPAEVCQTGFGLIVTEPVAQRALCFLCGSTGLDPLLFCACCCEPYHQYCVLDEYNLKHSSLDDTMASLMLDSSTLTNGVNTNNDSLQLITQRLNWLCPRCTVCYTCNMSSGSKVKCQKCQKNYHSTCLGTSKRLLGADRPLICVNCLKCKSCSTTKVSKFVGNLPLCMACFKLRKRGNFCPICQKCYDDNDSDPKTMECGDCNQWVHSKCEGLSDEQYNLLSTLPETIEFICKKCAKRNEHSKQRAQEWRQVVTEEFKSSLMSVLKLLSKSHQACALLKLSPRKKVNCSCSSPMNNSNGNGRIQPKALLFNTSERDPLGSDGESQCSEDIYEFSESQPVMMQLNTVSTKQKQNLKCNCVAFNTEQSRTNTNSYYNSTTESMQQTHQTQPLSLVDIKKKISNNLYTSLAEFNYDMNNVIQQASCDELIITYKEILSEQFPWFQNETKACTDALEEDMFESCSSSYGMNVGGVGGSAASNSNYIAGASNTADLDNNNRPADLPPGLEDIVFSYKSRQDARVCLFCRKTGEGISNEESRLLYCGQDCWVHTNCAMWSAEVFEEIDGSLQNVHSAVSRGRMIKCTVCGNRGATVGCNIKSCGEHYHYPCARSINCAFLTDKTMYCPTHARDGIARNITSPNIAVETNFEVVRPVYVELDRRRKKLIDLARVKFHIGSLEVKQLGTVFPRFSDSFEAIIPINFLCSRLYWSCKQPWKIVEYTVRTIIQNSYSTLTTNDMGRNFTVDHSSTNGSLVQLGLAQIARWHSSLSRGDLIETENVSNLCEYATGARGTSTFAKILPDYMPHTQSSLLTSNATNATTDENTEEEPQTNADLLPPDLKDAIFEDLPHELLDGISMLDIFPKFMNYEDLGNASDCKSEAFLNEQSKDAVSITTTATAAGTTPSSNMSDNDDTMNSAFSKQLELSNSWSSSSTTNSISVNHVEDAMLGAARCQFKRSLSADCHKADNLLRRVGGSSISAAAAAIKRRRLSKTSAECVALSLSQQQRLKKEKLTAVALARRQSQANDADYLGPQRTKTFTWSAAKRYMETETTDNSPELNGIKLMQVDGVDDSITEFRIINGEAQLNGTVKCERCQCTYRNYESFQRHLANCEPLSTSESDSERAPSSSPSDNVSTTHTAATLLSADGINGEFSKLTRTATLSNGVSTTTASLPFLQAFQQATNTSIPIGGVQTTANIGGIPIASMQTQQAAGMQNFQGLQNLQNLQFQNFQPQTIGGGNFFISQAAPTTSTPNGVVVSGADDLQFFSNALQSLTANLNGTYTLAPTTTSFAMQPQTAAAAQPQLIAISTNADGTQQFIQLPTATTTLQNPQFIQTSSNGFPTLQATNVGEKKFVIPLTNKQFQGSNKLNSKTGVPPTVATAAAKQKLKANGSMKHIQTKIAPNTTTNGPQITVLNASNGISSAQVINQSLLQQLQAAANAQQQPLLFQAGTANQQTPIIMQQPTQNIISFVTPDGAQYVSIPTNDFKAQPTPTASYITASPAAASGTTYLQTDASGNLVLTTSPANTTTNGHLQMLSATALNQPAQVIGTLIQPQTLQLNGNVLTATSDGQQPVIIGGTTTGTGGTTGLEMISAANGTTPQVILATQPMYYGLETIVQNTVMSSQQFVSTAMPGVLSQNASFSATTTQVFQASKIEPLVDIPAGYVVLNNVDTNQSTTTQQPTTHSFLNATNILQQPSNSEQQQTNNLETIYRLQQQSQASNDKSTTSTTTYQFGTTPPIQQHQSQIITAKIQPVITQAKQRSNNNALIAKSVNNINATKVQPQVVNKVLPTSIAHQQQLQNKVSNIQKQTKASITPQPQQQAQPSNIFMRPTIATLPVSVATTNEPQHNLVTQPNKTSTSRYETSLITSQAQQIYTTPVQPMNATLTITTTTTQPTVSTVSSKPFTQTANMRKSNPIRPINKVEVKPKVLKTNLNATSSSTTTYAKTTTSKLKTQESSIMSTSHSNNATPTTQQTPQFSIITIAHPIDITEQQHSVSLKQQPQQTATIVYDQQQQPIVEYQINEQIPQNNIAETFKHQQQQRHHEILALHMPNPNSNNTNTTNNRLQLSNTNNVYNSNVPTNVVNPIQFTTSSHSNVHTTTTTTTTTTLTSRPTNRVLPMQQKQQQQDHNKTNNIYCSINSNTHNNNKQMQQTTTTTTTKCYASPTASLKSCFEADLTKKVEETTLEQFLQSEQTENQLQPETIQIMHVQQPQQQHEDVHLSSALSFELKNGELEMQQTSNSQLEQAVNNLPDYENTNGDNNDCLLDEKQRKKLIAAAYALNSDTNNAINDEVISNVANDVNVGEDDDDGFSLKMPTDDDGDMDLDHEISDSDEPAVKAKISRILDNLTNDDCNDSIATATTIEANAAMNIQPIRFMQTEICDSTTNKNLSKSKELTLNHKSTTMYDDKTVNSNNNVDTASFIQQMATQTDYVTEASEVLKKLKCELPSQPSIEVETEIKETIKHKEIPMTNETAEASVTTPTTFQTSQHMHPTPHFTPKDPKKITGPHLLYEIQSEDGFTYKSTSITEIWEKVFEAVQVARNAQGLAPLPEGPLADMSGVQMIGLKTNALKYLIEQLPGVEKCSKYTPKYHKRTSTTSDLSSAASGSGSSVSTASCEAGSTCSPLDYSSDQEDIQENPYYCARCEPYRYRSEYDMFSWLASRHRKQPIQVFVQPSDTEVVARRGTGSNLPMAMKYRTLKETYKDYVGVFRSHIHGRGLYCTKDIEAGEMVIEYAGELIRSTLTDKRERNYNSRGIGCYMFKIDENLVVDATMRGNAARFINHSCEPNCYSKVVDILGHKHIIIFALRRIVQGEELTYDYKFPFEEEKIPCSCGSKKCRKYLN